MATGTIPFSNPGGNNQMSKGVASPIAMPVGTKASTPIPGSPAATPVGSTPLSATNPYVPPSSATPPGTTPSVPNVGGLTVSPSNTAGTTGAVQKQLVDIYGKGVGGELSSLLAGMSGSDSVILQEYIASLQPQMATAQSNVNAALGAGGVSANSSVAAIADSNLQANETAAIAGESASLTKSQEELTAQILTGMEGASAKEVATSGWSVFGDVMNQISGDVGDIFTGGSFATKGNKPDPTTAPAATIPSSTSSNDSVW